MKINMSDLYASVNIAPNVYCPNCNGTLLRINNGLLGSVWICKGCHSVYQLHLIKVPKRELNKEYMEYALEELNKNRSKKG